MMDLRTLVTFSTLVLVVADQTSVGTTPSAPSPLTTQTSSSSSRNYSGSSTRPSTASPTSDPISPPPALGLLSITWMGKCEEANILVLSRSSSSTSALCQGSAKSVESRLRIVCEDQEGQDLLDGSDITKEGAVTSTSCETLKVQCPVDEVLQNVRGQLHAYKVVTALLCCLLLVLLLIRFTRPTVKVLQKRLSDRRQNRWIGPTQSHSEIMTQRAGCPTRVVGQAQQVEWPDGAKQAVMVSKLLPICLS
ncbi:uncharacterized protein cd5 isoform 2-T2 [Spinachia spinachia]